MQPFGDARHAVGESASGRDGETNGRVARDAQRGDAAQRRGVPRRVFRIVDRERERQDLLPGKVGACSVILLARSREKKDAAPSRAPRAASPHFDCPAAAWTGALVPS